MSATNGRNGERYMSCGYSLCPNGGILAPGEKRVAKDGEIFHTRCSQLAAEARQTRQQKLQPAPYSRI